MKIVGRRFWTWMSVWALAFFAKGDLTAGPQEKGTAQVTNGTSSTKHKVPLLKTRSHADVTTNVGTGMSKAAIGEKRDYSRVTAADKTSPILKMGSSNPRVGGKTPSTLQSERLKTTSATAASTNAGMHKVALDASSKDQAKTTSKTHTHKVHK